VRERPGHAARQLVSRSSNRAKISAQACSYRAAAHCHRFAQNSSRESERRSRFPVHSTPALAPRVH
jgi:hypothetical protein